MKIVMIHGQNHAGSTCMVARELAHKVGGEIREFFLPRDFDEPCLGCYTCFQADLTHCPHYQKLEPLVAAILEAELLILDSPVYVYHATGQMMSFLDHFGTWWVVHRPRSEMAHKQAVVISTAAGGGMKRTAKDMADSLEMWVSARCTGWASVCRQQSLTRSRHGSWNVFTKRQTMWPGRFGKTREKLDTMAERKSGFT